MRILILILLPFFLNGQSYQLDSVRYTTPSEWNISRYAYENEKDFTRYYESYDENGFEFGEISEFVDSLQLSSLYYTAEGDSFFSYSYFDELARLILQTRWIQDTLQTTLRIDYLQNTNLTTREELIHYMGNDTMIFNLEELQYDSLLRITYEKHFSIREDGSTRLHERWRSFLGDSVSYSFAYDTDGQGEVDSFYSKRVQMPHVYYGDTLRTGVLVSSLTKDSIVLNTNAYTYFKWGSFSKFEDAGDWSYHDGSIQGYYIDYGPAIDGFTFDYFENSWLSGDPENWRYDIEHKVIHVSTGRIVLNDAGLPVRKEWTDLQNGITAVTEYFYSVVSSNQDILPDEHRTQKCRIIYEFNTLNEYYDLSGVRIEFPATSMMLVEKNKSGSSWVLFVEQR